VSSRLHDDDTLPPDVVRAFGDIAPRRRPAYDVASAAASARGAARADNEDAWGQRHGRAFVVADGMGGRPGGAGAAAVTVAGLLDELSGPQDGIDWSEAVARVNAVVIAHAADHGHRRVGAAAAAVRFAGGRLTVLHLGDVRAYRLRGEQIELLTSDHTLGEELERAGLRPGQQASDLEALSARDLAGLTTFFGDPGSSERFTVRSLSVRDGDRIALCTDGVHRHVPAASWQQASREAHAAAVAELLVGSALAHGATDDATALVIRFTVTADGR
jgi:protein phosphatase